MHLLVKVSSGGVLTCVLRETGAVAVTLCGSDAMRAHCPPVWGESSSRCCGLGLARTTQGPLAWISVPGAVGWLYAFPGHWVCESTPCLERTVCLWQKHKEMSAMVIRIVCTTHLFLGGCLTCQSTALNFVWVPGGAARRLCRSSVDWPTGWTLCLLLAQLPCLLLNTDNYTVTQTSAD